MNAAAFALISNDEDRILFSHRRDVDLWNLPGGGVEPEESPWDCVVREITEETGLVAKVIRLQGVYAKPWNDQICFSFICKVVGGSLQLTDEADQHEFFGLDGVPPNTSPNHVARLKDFFSDPHRVFWRNDLNTDSNQLLRKLGKLQ